MPESKEQPRIKRLQGGILAPFNIQEIEREEEDGNTETFYKYNQIKIADNGQKITDNFVSENYRQLRREYILSQMPQHEQNEAVVEQADGDDTKMQRLIEVKQRAKELFPK